MIKKSFFLFGLICSYAGLAFPQIAENYMNKSIDGYIHLYFDEQYFLVDQNCEFRMYTRVTKYDKDRGGFNGFFTDYYNNDIPALTGEYEQGRKNGIFKGFYDTGKRKFIINFKNDIPEGSCHYFYPSGEPWVNLNYKDGTPYLLDYWNEKGKKKVDDGKGLFEFDQTVHDFNEFGFKSVKFKGRVKDGRPNGAWDAYLTYPKGADELIGNEYFSKGRFVYADYSFPKNLAPGTSMVKLTPFFNSDNAHALTYKNCTIDDDQGFNYYLQNLLNTSPVLLMALNTRDSLQNPEVEVMVDEHGRSKEISLSGGELQDELTLLLKKALTDVPYWIPSYKNGHTIGDTIHISFSMSRNEEGAIVFNYPLMRREKGK